MRNQGISSRINGRAIRSLIFFILFYLYLWLQVDPRLIYHGGGEITNFPVFIKGWTFFREFILYPGGVIEYLSAFLAQFFYVSWAGAIIVTLQSFLFCSCVDNILKVIKAPFLSWIRFIPPILLLILYAQYTFHFLTTMALLMGLVFVLLFLSAAPVNKFHRLIVFLVLSILLYYIIGAAYLLFATICVIYELLLKRSWQTGLLYVLSAVIIPYILSVTLLGKTIIAAYSNLLPFYIDWWAGTLTLPSQTRQIVLVYILYLFLPAFIFGLGIGRTFVSNAGMWYKITKLKTFPFSDYFQNKNLKCVLNSLILFMIAGLAVFYYHDSKRKSLFEVDYYSYHKMWPQVLQAASKNINDALTMHAVNRALYHTGRLVDGFFFPPDYSEDIGPEHWQRFDTLLEIGLINQAEHSLTELIAVFGPRPVIFKRLAFINMVKNDINAARVYLSVLSKTFFYDDWANSYLDKIEVNPDLSTDENIRRLRSLIMEKDYTFVSFNEEGMLSELLVRNKQNQMAFEYLMASYLLGGNLEMLALNFHRLDDFNYSKIPRLYEEAILLYTFRTGKVVNLNGYQISRQSIKRFDAFLSLMRRYKGDKQAMSNEMGKKYRDSYFFFDIYRPSGIK